VPDNVPFFVPFKINPHFVGREDDLRRLHAALQGDQAVGIIPAGITGQGGVGKTQLAVRYAYQFAEHYPDGVYWLTVNNSLDKVFAEFGQQLWQIMPYRLQEMDTSSLAVLARLVHTLFDDEEVPQLCFDLNVEHEDVPGRGLLRAQALVALLRRQERLTELTAQIEARRPKLVNRPQDELIRLAFAYLRDNPRSLLVLDNLPDPAVLHAPLSRDWIPAQLPGSLLFTTRQRYLDGCRPVELTVLPEPVALQLLLRHPQRRPALAPGHPDHQTARAICALLGYLPLALEVAGAHLGLRERAPMDRYLAELRERGAIGVLDDARLPVTPAVHEKGVAAVLDSQFQSLASGEARMLLRVAGLFPEAALIPVARLGLLAGIPEAGESFFDVTLDQALGDLEKASLVEELKEARLRLHPLVREYAAGTTADNAAFARQGAEKLVQAYEDFPTLERQCARRGIDAVQEDLLAALDLLAPQLEARTERLGVPPWRKVTPAPVLPGEEPAYDLPLRLQTLLRLLQREVHTLREWQPQAQPLRFKQQMLYRAFDLQIPEMLRQIMRALQDVPQVLTPTWNNKQESLALERTLRGHSLNVTAVAVTPDGRRAVSASADHTLKVWDLATGAAERTLRGHSARVLAVAVTPDGRQAVSASDDHTLKVWDLATGAAERTLRGHPAWVSAVAVTPDGRRAVSAADYQTLKVWDLATGAEERTLRGHASWVYAVAVTPDGRRAVSASHDHTLKVWDLATGAEERTLRGHSARVLAVAVTPDGRRAVSASADHTLKVWDLATGAVERTLWGHYQGVSAVAVTPDGRQAVSASDDRTLKVWDLATGAEKFILRAEERTLRGHSARVLAVAVTPDGRRAVSASEDHTLKVWDLATEAEERTLRGHSDFVTAVAVTPDGRWAVSASSDHTLKVWDLATGAEERTLAEFPRRVWAVAVTPDGRRAVSASDDDTLKVWDLATGAEKFILGAEERTLAEFPRRVWAVAVTLDGRRAVSASEDHTLKVWDLATGAEERTLRGHASWVYAVAVTPDGRQAVSASRDHTLKVWDLATGAEEHTLRGHSNGVRAVALTPDGRQAVSASADHTLKVWDLATGAEERTLRGHAQGVMAVAVTPDGRRAVSASNDHTLKVWDLATGQELASITLDGPLSCVAVAQDGVTIVTGDGAGGVYCLRYVAGDKAG